MNLSFEVLEETPPDDISYFISDFELKKNLGNLKIGQCLKIKFNKDDLIKYGFNPDEYNYIYILLEDIEKCIKKYKKREYLLKEQTETSVNVYRVG